MHGGLVLVAACGFMNPVAVTSEGAATRARLRVGISAAMLMDRCIEPGDCSVQLDLGHFDDTSHRIEIVAVRLMVGGKRFGRVDDERVVRDLSSIRRSSRVTRRR